MVKQPSKEDLHQPTEVPAPFQVQSSPPLNQLNDERSGNSSNFGFASFAGIPEWFALLQPSKPRTERAEYQSLVSLKRSLYLVNMLDILQRRKKGSTAPEHEHHDQHLAWPPPSICTTVVSVRQSPSRRLTNPRLALTRISAAALRQKNNVRLEITSLPLIIKSFPLPTTPNNNQKQQPTTRCTEAWREQQQSRLCKADLHVSFRRLSKETSDLTSVDLHMWPYY